MRDLRAVLVQKESDIQRVRREIAALRFVLPLLSEDPSPSFEPPPTSPVSPRQNKWPLEVTGSR